MFEHHEVFKFNPSPHSPHTKIISYVGNDKKVLDVGCATGYIAKELKQKGCSVVGVEINRELADIARTICDEVIIGDVEQIRELPFPNDYFDVIIYSDVLEHMKRPDLVLFAFKRYLNSNGFVIASIPNIARLEFRMKLLLGKFEYEQSGILSKGHLRFFTLRTAKQLFEISGYKISKIDYTGMGSIFRILPTCLAFQFLIIAKKEYTEGINQV